VLGVREQMHESKEATNNVLMVEKTDKYGAPMSVVTHVMSGRPKRS
jgi:hypothetical protein